MEDPFAREKKVPQGFGVQDCLGRPARERGRSIPGEVHWK